MVMATTAPCLLVVLLCAQAFATSQSPHIVYVVADDLGWNDIGYRGNTTDVQTPKLDELAASGCRLEQFYAQQVCSPSRAAILTGKFPYRLGLSHGFIAAGAPYGLPLEERTMAQQLRDVGYATHIVGKVGITRAASCVCRAASHANSPVMIKSYACIT